MTSAVLARSTAFGLIVLAIMSAFARFYLAGGLEAPGFVIDNMSPFRELSHEQRETVAALITIPLGIIALVMVRQFIGIQTLGTFMPVLIGVAFRLTGPFTGLVLFLSVMVIGILFRALFGRMRLLLVPRLAAVLIVIVCCMLLITVGGKYFQLNLGSSATLFPLVILAMTIERLVITWEESGGQSAIKHLAGSLFIALLAYAFMTLPFVEKVMFAFPETLMVLLAMAILIGRYTGFKLTEYFRFRHVGDPE